MAWVERTKYDMAVWNNLVEGQTYAFPIGAPVRWGGVAYPLLRNQEWEFEGYLPKGMVVTNSTTAPPKSHRITCTLGGITVVTADWAIAGDDEEAR